MTARADSRERLARALRDVGARCPEEAAVELLAELEDRYAQPHRAYHTMVHVETCLAWLDWYRAEAARPAEVELALWFHDAVYDPRRGDNEERSAALVCARLGALGVSEEVARRVGELILATRAHQAEGGDAALVCSIDLGVLGADWEEFEAYEEGVRREYRHVPDEVFGVGRAGFLRGLLQRAVIYPNRAIQEHLEAAARRNIERALIEGPTRAASIAKQDTLPP